MLNPWNSCLAWIANERLENWFEVVWEDYGCHIFPPHWIRRMPNFPVLDFEN